MRRIDEEDIIGFRFEGIDGELVCKLCCTKREWKRCLENAEDTNFAFVCTEDNLNDMGKWAEEMVCSRCHKKLIRGEFLKSPNPYRKYLRLIRCENASP